MRKSVKIAIVQSGAPHLNLEASMQQARKYLEEAAQKKVDLIVFGETWLSGYPAWLDYCPEVARWDHEPTKEVFAQMYANSVAVKGPEVEELCHLAGKYQMNVVMGINEKINQGPGNGSLYNSFLILNEEGHLVNHHRKLMPTYTERMVHSIGDAQGLQVVDTAIGRLGGLICWEHWMPLSRQALHQQGEHFHIALWPKVHEMHQIACRNYAFEGRCFVVGVGQMLQAKDFPKALKLPDDLAKKPKTQVLNGGSCIVAPNGYYELEPQYDQEGLIISEIKDLDRIYKERMTLDVSGHYSRSDIFNFDYRKERKN